MFDRRTNQGVSALAVVAGLALLAYLATVEEAGRRVGVLRPSAALSATACFLLLGPGVVLEGQRRVERLRQALSPGPVPPRRNAGHAALVVVLGTATTLSAWLPVEALRREVFPMPTPAAQVVYLLASSGAVFLCAHGIWTAAQFLTTAHGFGRATTNVLEALTQQPCESVFRSTHEYVAWSFSVVGALQLPVLLLFMPVLPTASQVVAGVFIVILVFVGSFLFWLPRHWQRARLDDEAAGLVREVAAGAPVALLERLPAYEFWRQRLRTTGLSLTLPAVAVATLTRLSDVQEVLTQLREAFPSS